MAVDAGAGDVVDDAPVDEPDAEEESVPPINGAEPDVEALDADEELLL